MENISQVKSPTVNESQNITPLWQQPLTKAALFVIAFLFAGSAAGAHFAGWGFPAVVGFSVASGVTFLAVVISVALSCFSNSGDKTDIDWTQFEPDQNATLLKDIKDETLKEGIIADIRSIKKLTNRELILALPDMFTAEVPSEVEKRIPALFIELKFRLEYCRKTYLDDESAFALSIQDFTASLPSYKCDKIEFFITFLINTTPVNKRDSLQDLLELLPWPNDEVRTEVFNLLANLKQNSDFFNSDVELFSRRPT